MNSNINYLAKYQAINAKLKKRFLKKPNLAEGSAEFDAISKHLEAEEQAYHYAALFAKAQAKCEGAQGNYMSEANSLLRSAQLYLKAENELCSSLSISLHENLELAIGSFVQAAQVFESNGQPLLAVSTYIQLANALMHYDKFAEASVHLEKASDLVPTDTLLLLSLLRKLATCKLQLSDTHAALMNYTRMQEILQRSGAGCDGQLLLCFDDEMRNCEVSRVLLLCLLGKSIDKLEPAHADTMRRYAWLAADDESPQPYMPPLLSLGLQSLVCACESNDATAVEEIHEQVFQHLSEEQNVLLYTLAEQLRQPTVSGIELGQTIGQSQQESLLKPF